MAKRCICGRSKRLPVCDGSHSAESWACRANGDRRAPWCFVASQHEENIAERLASERGGIAAHMVEGRLRAERLIVLSDGTALDEVKREAARVDAPHRRVIALQTDPSVLACAFEGYELARADGDESLALWTSVLSALDGDPTTVTQRALTRAFVSHAVSDEQTILPVVDYLRRHFGADLFLCADSIAPGSSWQQTIVNELEKRQLLVLLLSADAAASTFCAFEAGYAMARTTPIRIISLDGERPPAYVQHLHMLDLERRRAARPWLDIGEALADALLELLADGK
jgi:hypothetical protein